MILDHIHNLHSQVQFIDPENGDQLNTPETRDSHIDQNDHYSYRTSILRIQVRSSGCKSPIQVAHTAAKLPLKITFVVLETVDQL